MWLQRALLAIRYIPFTVPCPTYGRSTQPNNRNVCQVTRPFSESLPRTLPHTTTHVEPLTHSQQKDCESSAVSIFERVFGW